MLRSLCMNCRIRCAFGVIRARSSWVISSVWVQEHCVRSRRFLLPLRALMRSLPTLKRVPRAMTKPRSEQGRLLSRATGSRCWSISRISRTGSRSCLAATPFCSLMRCLCWGLVSISMCRLHVYRLDLCWSKSMAACRLARLRIWPLAMTPMVFVRQSIRAILWMRLTDSSCMTLPCPPLRTARLSAVRAAKKKTNFISMLVLV